MNKSTKRKIKREEERRPKKQIVMSTKKAIEMGINIDSLWTVYPHAWQYNKETGTYDSTGSVFNEESAEAAQEIAAARHDHGKHGGDHVTFLDLIFIPDGIEFSDHLRQSPATQGRQYHHEKQVDGIRPENGRELPTAVSVQPGRAEHFQRSH